MPNRSKKEKKNNSTFSDTDSETASLNLSETSDLGNVGPDHSSNSSSDSSIEYDAPQRGGRKSGGGKGKKSGGKQKQQQKKKGRVADSRTLGVSPESGPSTLPGNMPPPMDLPAAAATDDGGARKKKRKMDNKNGEGGVSASKPPPPYDLSDSQKQRLKGLDNRLKDLWNIITHAESEEEAALVLPDTIEPLGTLYCLWLDIFLEKVPLHVAEHPELAVATSSSSNQDRNKKKSSSDPVQQPLVVSKLTLLYMRDTMDWFTQFARCKPFAKHLLEHLEDRVEKAEAKQKSHQNKLASGKTDIVIPIGAEVEDLKSRFEKYGIQKKEFFSLLKEGERFPWQLPTFWTLPIDQLTSRCAEIKATTTATADIPSDATVDSAQKETFSTTTSNGGKQEVDDEVPSGDAGVIMPPPMMLLPPSEKQGDALDGSDALVAPTDRDQLYMSLQEMKAYRVQLDHVAKWSSINVWESLLDEKLQRSLFSDLRSNTLDFEELGLTRSWTGGGDGKGGGSRGNSPLLGPSSGVPGVSSDQPFGSIISSVPKTFSELQQRIFEQRQMLEPPTSEAEAAYEGAMWVSMDPVVYEVTALCGTKVVPAGALAYLPHNDSVRSYLCDASVDFVVPAVNELRKNEKKRGVTGGGHVDPVMGKYEQRRQRRNSDAGAAGSLSDQDGGGSSSTDTTPVLRSTPVPMSVGRSPNMSPQMSLDEANEHYSTSRSGGGRSGGPKRSPKQYFESLQRRMEDQGIHTEISTCGRKMKQIYTTSSSQEETKTSSSPPTSTLLGNPSPSRDSLYPTAGGDGGIATVSKSILNKICHAELVLAITVPAVGRDSLATPEEVLDRIFWEGSQWNSIIRPNPDSALWIKSGNRRRGKVSHVFVCTLETVEADIPLELALSAMWKLMNLDPPAPEDSLSNKMLDAATATALLMRDPAAEDDIADDRGEQEEQGERVKEDGDQDEGKVSSPSPPADALELDEWLRKVKVAVRVNHWPLISRAVRFNLTSYKEGIFSSALFAKYFNSQEILRRAGTSLLSFTAPGGGSYFSFSSQPGTPASLGTGTAVGHQQPSEADLAQMAEEAAALLYEPSWIVALYLEIKDWFRKYFPTQKLTGYSKCLLMLFYLLQRGVIRWINPMTCLDTEKMADMLLSETNAGGKFLAASSPTVTPSLATGVAVGTGGTVEGSSSIVVSPPQPSSDQQQPLSSNGADGDFVFPDKTFSSASIPSGSSTQQFPTSASSGPRIGSPKRVGGGSSLALDLLSGGATSTTGTTGGGFSSGGLGGGGFLPSNNSLEQLPDQALDHLKAPNTPKSKGISLADFLSFYSDEFQWWRTAVSIDCDSNRPSLEAADGASMDIRDPFNPNRNVARHMTYADSRGLRKLMALGEDPVTAAVTDTMMNPRTSALSTESMLGVSPPAVVSAGGIGAPTATEGGIVSPQVQGLGSPLTSPAAPATTSKRRRVMAMVRFDGVVFNKQTIKDFVKALRELSSKQESVLVANGGGGKGKDIPKSALASFGVHDVGKIGQLGEAVFGSRAFDEHLMYRSINLQDVCECQDMLEAMEGFRKKTAFASAAEKQEAEEREREDALRENPYLSSKSAAASTPGDSSDNVSSSGVSFLSRLDPTKPYIFDRLRQPKYVDRAVTLAQKGVTIGTPTPSSALTAGSAEDDEGSRPSFSSTATSPAALTATAASTTFTTPPMTSAKITSPQPQALVSPEHSSSSQYFWGLSLEASTRRRVLLRIHDLSTCHSTRVDQDTRSIIIEVVGRLDKRSQVIQTISALKELVPIVPGLTRATETWIRENVKKDILVPIDHRPRGGY